MGALAQSKESSTTGLVVSAQAPAHYRPRRPEETVLYRAIAANYRTLEALAELEGKRLPQHVTKEFESFLRCGILAYGFLRLRCEDCHKDITDDKLKFDEFFARYWAFSPELFKIFNKIQEYQIIPIETKLLVDVIDAIFPRINNIYDDANLPF